MLSATADMGSDWCRSVPLWRSAARLEEQGGSVARARALLEQGRSKNLKEPDIWLAAVRTEQRAGLPKAADALMAKALQASMFSLAIISPLSYLASSRCVVVTGSNLVRHVVTDYRPVLSVEAARQAWHPLKVEPDRYSRAQENPTSGVLWAEAISMAPRPQRRAKSVDALKRCNDDPHIIAAVAQLFKNDGKVRRTPSSACISLEHSLTITRLCVLARGSMIDPTVSCMTGVQTRTGTEH